MNSPLKVIPARPGMADEMAPDMRAADREEVLASDGFTPLLALRLSVAGSTLCWAGVDEEGIVFMAGVGAQSLISPVGAPWLLGTERMDLHRRAIAKVSRPYVEEMQSHFKLLENWVDARNAASIRWLAWCGFILHPAAPYGLRGKPFHRFTRERG